MLLILSGHDILDLEISQEIGSVGDRSLTQGLTENTI
jgi:hypothetical protein